MSVIVKKLKCLVWIVMFNFLIRKLVMGPLAIEVTTLNNSYWFSLNWFVKYRSMLESYFYYLCYTVDAV